MAPRHVRSDHGREGLPVEGFWNNYWTMLLHKAQLSHASELCREQSAPRSHSRLAGCCGSIPCKAQRSAGATLAAWCADARRWPPPTPVPVAKSALLLGGDSHYGRELLVYRLFSSGVLDKALWSFSTPSQCSVRGKREQPRGQEPRELSTDGRAAWAPFCEQFANGPKRLDRDLNGPLEMSNKVPSPRQT